MATVRVGFMVGAPPPPEPPLYLSRAKVEVFDPDGQKVGGAEASGDLPLGEMIYFPDLSVRFDKGGTYTFLVSAWDSLCTDIHVHRDHKIKPLVQRNSQKYIQTQAVLIDPGHGAGSENYGTHGCWYSIVPPGETPNTNRYSWDEKDMALELGLTLRASLSSVRHERGETRLDIYMSRGSDAGKTLRQRVEWANGIAKRVLQRDPNTQLRFVSLHGNGNENYRYIRDFVAWRKAADSPLADSVLTGLRGEPSVPMSYGKEYHGYLVLTCKVPAVLVETCTLTNPGEEDWVRWQTDPANIRRLADRLRDGILISFN